MRLLMLFISSLLLQSQARQQKYGNDFITYSIGERYEKGDVLIRNETIESRVISRKWPRVHRLEFKIPNHDDLLSFAQIEILDTDDPHEVRIKTHKDGHEIYIASPAKLRGFASFYHKENSNLYPISKLIPSLFGMLSLDDYYELLPKQT